MLYPFIEDYKDSFRNPNDYFDKLKSIGFKVIEEDYTNKITPELVEKYCLAKGEIIPICFK